MTKDSAMTSRPDAPWQPPVPVSTLTHTDFIAQQNIVDPQATPAEPLIVVSFADADRESAKELLKCLKKGFSTRTDDLAKQIEFWDYTESLRLGVNDHSTIQDAFKRASMGLLLVSPSACASRYIQEHEWPHFRDHSGNILKPFVPVLLDPVDPEKYDLGVLGVQGQNDRPWLFHLRHEGQNLTWNECKKDEALKNAFVEKLIDEILYSEKQETSFLLEKATLLCHEANMGLAVPAYAKTASLQGVTSKSAFECEIIPELKRWACDRTDSPFAVLLGEYGMGKTWTSQLLALELVNCLEKNEPGIPIPIYLDLRVAVNEKSKLLSEDVPPLEDLLESLSRNNTPPGETPLTAKEIFRAVREEGALLILDGLDEALVHKQDDAWGQTFINRLFDVLPFRYWPKHLNPKTQSPCPGKLLLTCRTHYFKNAQTQNDQILGLGREQHEAARPRAWQLLPFNKTQILKYLELHVPEQPPHAVYTLIAGVHDLSEVSSRPQGIKMVCGLIKELEEAKRNGKTVNGATLYAMMVNKWLDRDKGKHQLSENVKRRLMQNLALYMWQRRVRKMPWDDLCEWLTNELKLGVTQKEAEPFLTDLRIATFLVRPDRDVFAFAHTSFLEYFLAVRLHRSLEEDDVGVWEDLNPSHETLNFLFQHHQISASYNKKKACDTLAKHLKQATANETARKSWLELLLLAPEEWPLKTLNISGLSLERYAFSLLTLDTLIADGANLAETRWSHCHFEHSSWQRANCRQMQCEHLSGAHADFRHANLSAGRWRHVNIDEINFDETLHADTLQRSPAATGLFPPKDCRLMWSKHSSAILACSISANGQRIITAGRDGRVHVWNGQGECLHILKGHSGVVFACSVSKDGQRMITAGEDGTARVWDGQGQCLYVLTKHSGSVLACSFSADGQCMITAGEDHKAHVWSERGKHLRSFQWSVGEVVNVDGLSVITAWNDHTARIWNQYGHNVYNLRGHHTSVSAGSVSANGKRMVTAEINGAVHMWDEHGTHLLLLRGHTGVVRACSVSVDGQRIITAGDDGTARVWNGQGQLLHILKGHTGAVLSCSMRADARRIVTAGLDGTARIWDEKGQCLHVLRGYSEEVRACSVSADGQRIVSAGKNGTVRIWNDKGECLVVLKGHDYWVRACSVSADGKIMVTAGDDRTARIWNEKGQCLNVIRGQSGSVLACSGSADGQRIITAGRNTQACVWNGLGEKLLTLEGHTGTVRACSASANGRRIITAGNDGTARVWDEKGKCLLVLTADPRTTVFACAMSADGQRMITAGKDCTARVWNEKGECLSVLEGHEAWVRACSISADGQIMVTAGYDGTARVWNGKGERLQILKGHSGVVRTCSMSADGRRIVTASSDEIRFWVSDDLNTWKCTLELHPQTQTIIWLDAKTQTLKLKGPDWPYWQLAHPDGNRLGETIAALGPMGHEQLTNADEWVFLPRDDIEPDDD